MLRVVHFADLHLGLEAGGRPNPESGLNQRFHDVCNRLDELCLYCRDQGVHAVVFAGDAFKHQHPSTTLQRLFAERIRRLVREGTSVFLLVGNHDLPKMAAHAHPFSIYDTLEVPGVVVGDRGRLYELDLPTSAPAPKLQIAALPHFSRQQLTAALDPALTPEQVDERISQQVHERIEQMAAKVDPSLPAIFAGHCHVNQAELNQAQNMFGLSELEVTLSTLVAGSFPYYALGHVHKRQVLSADPFVAYSGSLERADFGEGEKRRIATSGKVSTIKAEEKGFYRFDLDPATWRLASEPEFVAVDARRFLTVSIDTAPPDDPTDQVLAALVKHVTDAHDAFVKVIVRVDPADRTRVSHKAIKEALDTAYDVRLQIDAPEDAAGVRDPRFAERMSELESLQRYVETRDDWADDREELLRTGGALIAEVLSA